MLVALGAFFLVTITLWAQPEQSSDQPPGSLLVRVKTHLKPPTIHHDLTANELSRVLGQKKGGGLTHFELAVVTDLDTTLVTNRAGGTTFWVSGVNITLHYRSVDTYIASDYDEGGCRYRAVRDHEEEHARTDAAAVRRAAERIRALDFMAVLPTYDQPWQGVTREAGRARARDALQRLLAPVLQEMEADRRHVGEQLDTPEVQRRLGERCSLAN